MTARNSSQDVEHVQQDVQTSLEDLDQEPIPNKRKRRLVSFIICFITATGIVAYGFIEKSVLEYNAVSDVSSATLEAIKNGSMIVYTQEENVTYPVLFHLGLGLLSIIFGTFIDRFSLVLEELCHFKSRYNRSAVKLFKACFSGISWSAVGVVILIAAVSLILAMKTSFKFSYIIYILGGIGVGPLVVHLLNLNAQSEVDVSRLLEEQRKYPGYAIAWHYYFHYLKKALPVFDQIFTESDNPVQDEGMNERSSEETAEVKVQLSFKKLILLISHDCKTKDNLEQLDKNITRIDIKRSSGYEFPVYSLLSDGKQHKFVVMYAKEALETLKEMSKSERIKAIHEEQYKHEVKLLCRTLVSEILNDPLDDECSGMCVVVPIMAQHTSSLQNGGLVKLIMTCVKTDKRGEQLTSFMKASPPTRKTKLQHKQTGMSFSSNPDRETHKKDLQDLPSSFEETQGNTREKVQNNTREILVTSIRNPDEHDTLLPKEKSNELAKEQRQRSKQTILMQLKQLVKEDPQEYNDGKRHQEEAKTWTGEERRETEHDSSPDLAYTPSISCSKDEELSSDFANEGGQYPSEKECIQGYITSYMSENQPMSSSPMNPREGDFKRESNDTKQAISYNPQAIEKGIEKDKQESLNGWDTKGMMSNIPTYPNNGLPNSGNILPYPNNPTHTSDNLLYPNTNPSYPTDIPSRYDDYTASISDNDAMCGRVGKCQRVSVIAHTPNFQHEEQTNTRPQSDHAKSSL